MSRAVARHRLVAIAVAVLGVTLLLAPLAGTRIGGAASVGRLELADPDGDGGLEWIAAPDRVERRQLVATDARRDGAARLLTFAQLSDLHIVDEESPIRTEFLDGWMGTAYRPQDGLTPHVLARMAAAVKLEVSRVTGTPAELVITTGDNTDTGQRNEVRWFIDILDGGMVDPDSGRHGTCDAPDTGGRYAGVRGAGRYWDPDGSGAGSAEGAGYDAVAARNQASLGRPSALRDAPGLFEAMNEPFRSDGVDVPWFAAFGNHDALVQGNRIPDTGLEALATGCRKVVALPPDRLTAAGDAAGTAGRDGMLDVAFAAMVQLAAGAVDDRLVRVVPGDPDRRLLTKREFIAEHFRTAGRPAGHGFEGWNLRTGEGYYTWLAAPGVRFVALDTVNETGGHQGNVDDRQFRWLDATLSAAASRRELVLAFGHHTLATMVQEAPRAHLGLGPGGEPEPCASPGSASPARETVRCLFLRHPALIAYVAGHEHRNRIEAHARPAAWGIAGGFWEIATASHIEWPQQARLVDLLDAGETLVIATTSIDHDSPATPVPAAGAGSPADLAALARELSFGDPQARNGRDGTADPRGSPGDRDADLLLPDPYAGR
jgi:metallophosphoesterase (TIGR03767 family)